MYRKNWELLIALVVFPSLVLGLFELGTYLWERRKQQQQALQQQSATTEPTEPVENKKDR